MSFNQSFNSTDNCDLYQLLSGFEKTTWTSFDFIRDRLAEQSTALSNIETLCRDFQSGNSSDNLPLISPVLNSINSDVIQQIRDKCEVIDTNVHLLIDKSSQECNIISSISDNINVLSAVLPSHLSGPSNSNSL